MPKPVHSLKSSSLYVTLKPEFYSLFPGKSKFQIYMVVDSLRHGTVANKYKIRKVNSNGYPIGGFQWVDIDKYQIVDNSLLLRGTINHYVT